MRGTYTIINVQAKNHKARSAAGIAALDVTEVTLGVDWAATALQIRFADEGKLQYEL